MSVKKVIQSLHKLNELHTTLLELGERKQQVLINNEVDELTRLTNEEAKLMKQVSDQERMWLSNIADFLAEKGLEPNPQMTMSELIKLVFDATDKQALIDAQQQLLATMDQLSQINALNQQLIEQSLAFINYTLDLLTDDQSELLGYSNPADKQRTNNPNAIFDTKA